MRVLVSGGTGFVGRPFVRRLLQEGWQVTMIVRDPKRAQALAHDRLTVHEADVSDADGLGDLRGSGRTFDAVFHLAASLKYFGNDQELYRINVLGTRNLLEVAIQTQAKRFIYASSVEAVGPVARSKVPAPGDTPCKPVSPYGKSKVLAEKLVRETAAGRFPGVALRIGNVYGPGHLNFIVEIAQALVRRNRLLEFLPVYADRYIHPAHTDDVTEGLLAATRSDQPYFVGTLAGEYATVGELFHLCGEVLGITVPVGERRLRDTLYLLARRELHRREKQMDFITYLMVGKGRRVHRAYSLEETRLALEFTPKVTLRHGTRQTLQWAQETGLLSC